MSENKPVPQSQQWKRAAWAKKIKNNNKKKKLKRQTCCSRKRHQTEGTDRQNETTDDSGVSEGPISQLCSHACILLCSTPEWNSSHMLKARLANRPHQNYRLVSLAERFYNPNPNPNPNPDPDPDPPTNEDEAHFLVLVLSLSRQLKFCSLVTLAGYLQMR